jgi:hypothetical protein
VSSQLTKERKRWQRKQHRAEDEARALRVARAIDSGHIGTGRSVPWKKTRPPTTWSWIREQAKKAHDPRRLIRLVRAELRTREKERRKRRAHRKKENPVARPIKGLTEWCWHQVKERASQVCTRDLTNAERFSAEWVYGTYLLIKESPLKVFSGSLHSFWYHGMQAVLRNQLGTDKLHISLGAVVAVQQLGEVPEMEPAAAEEVPAAQPEEPIVVLPLRDVQNWCTERCAERAVRAVVGKGEYTAEWAASLIGRWVEEKGTDIPFDEWWDRGFAPALGAWIGKPIGMTCKEVAVIAYAKLGFGEWVEPYSSSAVPEVDNSIEEFVGHAEEVAPAREDVLDPAVHEAAAQEVAEQAETLEEITGESRVATQDRRQAAMVPNVVPEFRSVVRREGDRRHLEWCTDLVEWCKGRVAKHPITVKQGYELYVAWHKQHPDGAVTLQGFHTWGLVPAHFAVAGYDLGFSSTALERERVMAENGEVDPIQEDPAEPCRDPAGAGSDRRVNDERRLNPDTDDPHEQRRFFIRRDADPDPVDEQLTADIREVESCRVCGCTDLDCAPCVEATGRPCTWVFDLATIEGRPICSRCAMEAVERVHPSKPVNRVEPFCGVKIEAQGEWGSLVAVMPSDDRRGSLEATVPTYYIERFVASVLRDFGPFKPE